MVGYTDERDSNIIVNFLAKSGYYNDSEIRAFFAFQQVSPANTFQLPLRIRVVHPNSIIV